MMIESSKLLQLIYTLFVGVLLAIFVGVGISAFYPGPPAPKFPTELNSYGKVMTVEQEKAQRDFDKNMEAYQEKQKPYSRNVSMIVLVAAVLFLVASILLETKIKAISDGVMLGGLFSLLYSIGRSFVAENSKATFLTVSISLAVVLYLGYHRLLAPHAVKPKKTSATFYLVPTRARLLALIGTRAHHPQPLRLCSHGQRS